MAEMDINNLDLSDNDDLQDEVEGQYVSLDDDVVTEYDDTYVDSDDEPVVNNNTSNDDRTVLNSLLKHYGINDPSKISFEENGQYSEKNWDDLSFDEKMNILKTSYESPERDLDDNEVDLINDMRRRNLSPAQYINQLKLESINEYQRSMESSQYLIDDLSDDEIFILDIQDKVEDATDEDIVSALIAAKLNESFFKKQVDGIRADLKKQEDAYNQLIEFNQQQQKQELFNNFAKTVNDSVARFNQIGDLDLNLDDNDRDDIMSFILDTDDTGMSTLGKALNDPKMLVRLSWFALHGEEAFKTILDYYNSEITKVNKSAYQRGLEDGKKSQSRVIYTKPIGGNSKKTINDIW